MAATPFALWVAERYGYSTLMAGSALIWLSGQLGMRQLLQGIANGWLGGLSPENFGAFNLLAWQLLWVLGLSLSHSPSARALVVRPLPRGVVFTALLASLAFISLRLLALRGVTLSPNPKFARLERRTT